MKINNKNKLILFLLFGLFITGVYIQIYSDNIKIAELRSIIEKAEKVEVSQTEAYDSLCSKFESLNEKYIETLDKLSELEYSVNEVELYRDILGFDIDNIEKADKLNWYYYSLLNDKQKKLYEKTLQTIVKQQKYEIGNTKTDDITEIVRSIEYDHPELFYINFHDNDFITYNEKTDTFKICGIAYDNLKSAEEIDRAWKEIKEYEKRALQNVNSFMSQEEIEKHIFNFLVLKTCYISGVEYNQSIYSVVKQETVCSGYAKMFKFLCDKASITCICIRGTHNITEEGHLWNIVQIDNINYMVDCTNALRSDEDKNVYIAYNFFNTSQEFMEISYSIDNWVRLPEVANN
ncbi:MAG: hypothetical protein HDR05_12555 [Lachnospiraceae bacterium]|nr:hypothetical protein [Lachnospiraceae bacterium]